MPAFVGSGPRVTAIVLSTVAATLVAFLLVVAVLIERIDLSAQSPSASDAREEPVAIRSIASPGGRPPVVIGDRATWFASDDYPLAALRREEQGRVKVRLAVDPAGRASACAVIESSGSAALDAGTCRIFVRRARFRPGRTGSIDMAAVRWVLP